jgi:hypothetical protein
MPHKLSGSIGVHSILEYSAMLSHGAVVEGGRQTTYRMLCKLGPAFLHRYRKRQLFTPPSECITSLLW